jgi:O-antigen ligase
MKILRAGLCVLLAFAVLAHGAVEVWSESIAEIAAGLLLAFWLSLALFNRVPEIRWNPLNWPLLAFLSIGLVQLLVRITAYPFLTRTELLRAGACWIVFFLATQAFRTRGELQMLAWFLVLFCFAVSLFAIVQYFTSGDELYWFRPVTAGIKPFGPYVNRNHFGGFIELTLPTGLAMLILRGVRRDQMPFLAVLTIVPISAVVLSSSRGGIIGVVVEIFLLMAFRFSTKGAEKIRLTPIAAVIAATILLIGWVGASNAMERFFPGNANGVSFARRASMVHGALDVFLAHPFSGSGLGTIVAVYPRYETMYDGKLVDHVHNDYAEALAETGILGAACGVVFLFFLFRDGRRNFAADQGQFSRALHCGAIAAVVGLLLHSFVDFNLHIFSNAMLFLVQAFLVTSPPVPSGASVRGADSSVSFAPEMGTGSESRRRRRRR